MSADNGIYVLKTRSAEDENATEFRVVHAQAIENIYWSDSQLDPEEVVRYFGQASVITNGVEALVEAQNLYDRHGGYVEYGIQILDHTDVVFTALPAVR